MNEQGVHATDGGSTDVLAGLERVLVIGAHPDDNDFGCAGTTAFFSANGVEVSYCVITDGDAGGFDPDVPRSEIPGIRRAEQTAAAGCIGVAAERIHFLGYRDGELTVTHGLRRDLSRVIRQVRPHLVILQSPERNWDRIYPSHPDHLAAGEATMQAVYPDSRNPFAHPSLLADEDLQEWTVPQVWVMAMQPNLFIDVTDYFDHKVAALQAHESQTAHFDDLEGMLRGWLGQQAQTAGFGKDRLAEAFKRVNTL